MLRGEAFALRLQLLELLDSVFERLVGSLEACSPPGDLVGTRSRSGAFLDLGARSEGPQNLLSAGSFLSIAFLFSEIYSFPAIFMREPDRFMRPRPESSTAREAQKRPSKARGPWRRWLLGGVGGRLGAFAGPTSPSRIYIGAQGGRNMSAPPDIFCSSVGPVSLLTSPAFFYSLEREVMLPAVLPDQNRRIHTLQKGRDGVIGLGFNPPAFRRASP